MDNELKKCQRMIRFWQKRLDSLTVNVNGVNAKEKDKGKRDIPPTPPIEKRETEKEKQQQQQHACARAHEEFVPPSHETVVKYANSKKIPLLFVDYWLDCMSTNYSPPWFDCIRQAYIVEWRRSLLCYWLRSDNDKAWLEFKREHEETSRTPTNNRLRPFDWTLCAERCANCDGTRCLRGITTPPADDDPPRPPKECPLFQPANP